MSICRQNLLKSSLRRLYGKNLNVFAVRYMGDGHNEKGFLPDHDTMDEFMRIPMRKAVDEIRAKPDAEIIKYLNEESAHLDTLWEFPEEQRKKAERQMYVWKVITLLCIPGLVWLRFNVQAKEDVIHGSYFAESRNLPYKHVMNKRFPWKHGDKCTLIDPHCYHAAEHDH